jgi:RNA polymerase sigma-54 factor
MSRLRGAGEAVADEVSAEEFGTTEREDWENGTEGDDFDGIRETPSGTSRPGSEGDDDGRAGPSRRQRILQDHLRAQIAGMRLGPKTGRRWRC